nr:hypothetical protein [Tanacetum cinerariifolium]
MYASIKEVDSRLATKSYGSNKKPKKKKNSFISFTTGDNYSRNPVAPGTSKPKCTPQPPPPPLAALT